MKKDTFKLGSSVGEAILLSQNLFQPIVLNYSWLGVVCTDCLLPATRLQMKVTAMLLLCQVLHALCHCTQCSSDMVIFFANTHFNYFSLLTWSGILYASEIPKLHYSTILWQQCYCCVRFCMLCVIVYSAVVIWGFFCNYIFQLFLFACLIWDSVPNSRIKAVDLKN